MWGCLAIERAVAQFTIQRCLGRGGFGEVYKGLMARQGGVEVDVAIKVLRADLDPSSQGVQRLRDEGRLLGRLTHPTILRVYDLVVIQERAALITEYIPGDDLGHLGGGGDHGIPPRAVCEVVAQVAAALEAAWSGPSVTDGEPLHLVHRDIKPDNIRIDPHGVVKVLDFGVAQAQAVRREAHTSVSTITGSTQYLAPERMVQQDVGPESDVFALGCTLYEALSGDALFLRKSMRQMYLLMMDDKTFDAFITERCNALNQRLNSARALSLIRAMTAFRKGDRPSASQVASRCDTIGDSLRGPTLAQWCRRREWPPQVEVSGPLDGQIFTSAHTLIDPHAETLQLRPPRSLVRTQTLPTPLSASDRQAADREAAAREPVLGENGVGPRSTGERRIQAAAEAQQGPMPWSTAEMVALFTPVPALRQPNELRAPEGQAVAVLAAAPEVAEAPAAAPDAAPADAPDEAPADASGEAPAGAPDEAPADASDDAPADGQDQAPVPLEADTSSIEGSELDEVLEQIASTLPTPSLGEIDDDEDVTELSLPPVSLDGLPTEGLAIAAEPEEPAAQEVPSALDLQPAVEIDPLDPVTEPLSLPADPVAHDPGEVRTERLDRRELAALSRASELPLELLNEPDGDTIDAPAETVEAELPPLQLPVEELPPTPPPKVTPEPMAPPQQQTVETPRRPAQTDTVESQPDVAQRRRRRASPSQAPLAVFSSVAGLGVGLLFVSVLFFVLWVLFGG